MTENNEETAGLGVFGLLSFGHTIFGTMLSCILHEAPRALWSGRSAKTHNAPSWPPGRRSMPRARRASCRAAQPTRSRATCRRRTRAIALEYHRCTQCTDALGVAVEASAERVIEQCLVGVLIKVGERVGPRERRVEVGHEQVDGCGGRRGGIGRRRGRRWRETGWTLWAEVRSSGGAEGVILNAHSARTQANYFCILLSAYCS